MCESLEPGNNSILLHANCLPSSVLGAFHALVLIVTLTHEVDFVFVFVFLSFYRMRKLSLREVVTCPRAILAELGFDSRFVWVPMPIHWLSLLERGRDIL